VARRRRRHGAHARARRADQRRPAAVRRRLAREVPADREGFGGITMKTVHDVLDIDASSAVVWAALTDAGGLAGWWTSKVELDGDDRIVFTMGKNVALVMAVIVRDEPSTLVWKCVGGIDRWMNDTVRFELSPLDDGRTRLRFWHEYAVEPSDDEYGDLSF